MVLKILIDNYIKKNLGLFLTNFYNNFRLIFKLVFQNFLKNCFKFVILLRH